MLDELGLSEFLIAQIDSLSTARDARLEKIASSRSRVSPRRIDKMSIRALRSLVMNPAHRQAATVRSAAVIVRSGTTVSAPKSDLVRALLQKWRMGALGAAGLALMTMSSGV